MATKTFLSTALLIFFSAASAWQSSPQTATPKVSDHSRRSLLLNTPILAITSISTISNASTDTSNLQFTTTGSGLQYADVKLGSSSTPSPQNGQTVSIDYVMSTTGARYGAKIYRTVATGAPYRWK